METHEPSTKEKIEAAAKKCFLEKGFAGTSISYIAKSAGVPKGLPHHYFGSKEGLWLAVKMQIINHFFDTDILKSAPSDTLRNYLEYIIGKRFDLYANNPEVARLIHWQALESQEAELQTLTGLDKDKAKAWKDALVELHNKGEIRQDYSIDHLLLYIVNAASAPFMQSSLFARSQTQEQLESYKKMVIELLYESLKPM